ncbi:uncharacterized protein N7483_002593 [Penicillium malachiteum]|uniref:uncharacterized protein n=1 Tax=Penicillium malachiteum TaxID=1324776 RepID=UPI0025478738|nr:uncharacterized protein N7483_002593 [Penicillium malachiteum]KAJ5737468.1 hypothetical protein N7483_002593 [Penicillium malachiteum]
MFGNVEPVLRGTVGIAEPVLRGTVGNAEPVLRSMFDDAELVLRNRGHGDPQACRQEMETMTHGSVRRKVLIFSGPEISLLLCQVGYVSS